MSGLGENNYNRKMRGVSSYIPISDWGNANWITPDLDLICQRAEQGTPVGASPPWRTRRDVAPLGPYVTKCRPRASLSKVERLPPPAELTAEPAEPYSYSPPEGDSAVANDMDELNGWIEGLFE